MRVSLQFGEMRADDAKHASPGQPVVSGAYASANGYRPIGAYQQFLEALPSTFKGGGSFIATDDTVRLLAGTGSDLYSGSTSGWTSKIGSLSVNGRWRFTQFGDDIICTSGGEPIRFALTANTANPLTGSPPTASFCATTGDFVVLGRTDDRNNFVTWCGQGDCTIWPAGSGGSQSGEQPIYAGGKIMGLTSGEYCHVIQRFQVVRMSYTGDPENPFEFRAISTNDGCIAEGSVAQAGSLFFFYGDRGFTMFDGAQFRPIGAERIDKTFRERYSTLELQNLWAAVDPLRCLVIWVMPQRLWMYNWQLDRWTIADLPVTSAFTSFTTGVTLEEYSASYPDLDAAPYSLDDPRFSGGAPRLTVVNTDGTFGVLTGDNIAARISVGAFEPVDGRRARLRRVEPVIDASSGLTLKIGSQMRLGDALSETTVTQLNRLGEMPVRAQGRHFRATLDVAAGTSWDYLQAMIFDFEPAGRA